jgi:hypothetical protein
MCALFTPDRDPLSDLKFQSQRTAWDGAATEMAGNEERSAGSRKHLATITKGACRVG